MVRTGVIWVISSVLLVSIGLLAVSGVAIADETTLTVTVTDQDGEPIQGAEVTAEWSDGSGSDVTRSNGNALIDVPSDSTVDVSVEHEDYVQNVPKRVFDPTEGVTIEMAEPGTAELTVLDEEDGEPVENVQLRIEHTEIGEHDDGALVDIIETGPDGVAEIADIEQRSYAVDTRRAGYLDVETEFDLDDSEVSETIEIESARIDIEFLVTDDHFSPPQSLQGASITVDGSAAGETGSDGTQVTRLDVNDEYEITIDKDGYDAKTSTFRAGEEPETIEFSIQRTPEITIQPLQTAVVVGQQTQVTIIDAYADPVTGAEVTLNGENVGETDDQGQLRFNVTESGENVIEAQSAGLSDSVSIEGYDPAAEQPDDPPENGDDADDGDEDDEEDTDSFGPGFGVLVALVSLLGVAVALARRE